MRASRYAAVMAALATSVLLGGAARAAADAPTPSASPSVCASAPDTGCASAVSGGGSTGDPSGAPSDTGSGVIDCGATAVPVTDPPVSGISDPGSDAPSGSEVNPGGPDSVVPGSADPGSADPASDNPGSAAPSGGSTDDPSGGPSDDPSGPSDDPSGGVSGGPSDEPSGVASGGSSDEPSGGSTDEPTDVPSGILCEVTAAGSGKSQSGGSHTVVPSASDAVAKTGASTEHQLILGLLLVVGGVGLSLLGLQRSRRRRT